MIPVIGVVVTIFAIAPISAIITPFFPPAAGAEAILDVAIIISAILGSIIGYLIVIFLIVKFVIDLINYRKL